MVGKGQRGPRGVECRISLLRQTLDLNLYALSPGGQQTLQSLSQDGRKEEHGRRKWKDDHSNATDRKDTWPNVNRAHICSVTTADMKTYREIKKGNKRNA